MEKGNIRSLLIVLALAVTASCCYGQSATTDAFTMVGDTSFGGARTTTSSLIMSSTGAGYQEPLLSNVDYSMYPGFRGSSFYPLSQFLVSVTPGSGFNIAPIGITVAGYNFTPGSAVKLTRPGEPEIAATNVNVVSSNEITCSVNIAGAAVGAWSVSVDDNSSNIGTLADAFEVKTYAYDRAISINYPNPFDPARETTAIMYKLAKDTGVTLVIFTTTADIIYKMSYPPGVNGGRTGDNSITWDGSTTYGRLVSNGVYLAHVVEQSTGKTLARGKIAVIRR